ncbi:MAG: carbon starvation protein A [Planctomycetota bacterium]|nr:carbon starvation protein A [Planctomycetota bacterium]
MNAAVLAVAGLLLYFVAMRVYARWIEKRVYEMDNDEPTPAHETPDGVDFVACNKHVLFGHHFCSVAGAAPIVGPAIAVIWGWLPALLWVVFGTIFIGAVHDFGALALSAKRGGRTMGDIAGEILGPRAKLWFLGIIVLLTWIVIAVFAFLIAVLFGSPKVGVPQAVWPVNFEIVVAVLIGWWIYKRKGSLLWPSILAVTALYVVVFICAEHPEWGTLPPSLHLYDSPIVTWIVFLLVYSYIASVLPVRILLQPRDYINSHQLFLGLGALLVGIFITNPEVTAPAFNTNVDPDAPPIIPLLFITIACGAISGFHGLVASGTTSKQLNKMRDARTIGYGGMLGEGLLALVAILAVTAGLGSTAEWNAKYASWKEVGNSGIGNFVAGAATFLKPIVFGNEALAKTVVAVIVISFAATTLDTAARIQRFCLAELGQSFGIKALKNRYLAAAIAILPAAWLAIFTDGGRGPGSGGFILWPVFGTTNQLIGAITLLVLFFHLRTRKRPTLPIVIPLVFLVVMTTMAGVRVLLGQIEARNWVVVTFGSLFLILQVLVFLEAWRTWRSGRNTPVPGS